jgi:hypothetical protein
MNNTAVFSFSQNNSPIYDPLPTKITKNIFLGDAQSCDQNFFDKNNIGAVIQVMSNPPCISHDISRLHIDIPDKSNVMITNFFSECFNFIDSHIQSGKNIYIHCAMGISRSATIVIAYIMQKNKLSYNDAYKFVKEKRPQIDPNFGFCCQLMLFEKSLNL